MKLLSIRLAFCALMLCTALAASAPASVIRVKWDSPNDGPGNDWDHAFHTVTAALAAAAAGDEIWVAGNRDHPYYERITLKNGVGLYGGFAGSETARDERQWWVNETVLDGGQAGTVVTVQSGATTATVLSGFTIRNGRASNGGGIYCNSASPSILNNRITGNTSMGVGAGVSLFGSSAVIASCLIAENSGAQAGGGIYCSSGSPQLINNTVAGNEAVTHGGLILSNTTALIANTIVAFNSAGIARSGGTPTLRHNCVFGNTEYNYYNFAQDPTGADGNFSVDPSFVGSAAGDYRLSPGSPCIGWGDSSVVMPGWRELGGQVRSLGRSVDVGAYEAAPELDAYRVLRVKQDSPQSGPGNHWSNAYRTVSAAIAAAAADDEIWVAAGVVPYAEGTLNPHGSSRLYGGFAGVENSRHERDWRTNNTILDANGTGPVVNVASGAVSPTVVDGFTIRNGWYGVKCAGKALIANNTIYGHERGITFYSSVYDNVRVVITGNVIRGNGRGISCEYGYATITNNTICGNTAAGIFNRSASEIANNIVAFNHTGIDASDSAVDLWNNCVYNPDGRDYVGIAAGAGDIGADPRFRSAAYGRVHIQPDSPCVDAGLDSAVGPDWKDIDGQQRIQGARVDIGADESDGTIWPHYVPAVVRVSPEGDDSHDGSSWDLAKRTVQDAIQAASEAGDEVWVAAGTYTERVILLPFVYLYGGFTGDESVREERDWNENLTVLDGGGSGYVVTVRGGHRVGSIDGLTVRNGQHGIYCWTSSPTVTNSRITGNNADGLYCSSSDPFVDSNSITDNVGSGIVCVDSTPLLMSNTLSRNGQAGVWSIRSSPVIASNLISSNGGEGVFCVAGAPAVERNTILMNTKSGIFAGEGTLLRAENNIITGHTNGIETSTNPAGVSITGNTVYSNAYGINCKSSASMLTNNTLVGNIFAIGIRKASPSLSNNIVAFNEVGIDSTGGSAVLRNNCVYNPDGTNYSGLSAGAGDISADPLFADRAAGNLRLLPASPCINAGLDSAVGDGWLDVDGQPRVLGAHVDIGADEFLATGMTAARAAAAGAPVALPAMPVTAAWPDVFYVEQPDRASGIRVSKMAHTLAVGQAATVAGVMGTNADGERFIEASSVSGAAGEPPVALGMSLRTLGGASTADFSETAGTGQQGIIGGAGLNNIGLLVRLAGRVASVDAGGAYFVLSDGSSVEDPDGRPGVRVGATGMMPPGLAAGDFVVVTGISSCYRAGEALYPQVLARSGEDIQAVSP